MPLADLFLPYIWGGRCEQGFRRMAARNKPAGIRLLVYGMGKGKGGIEGYKRVFSLEASGGAKNWLNGYGQQGCPHWP